jgi:hypothetical protein
MVGTGFPAMKVIRRGEKQAFGLERVLVPFHIEFNVSGKNVEYFIFRVGMRVKINAGAFIAFAVPNVHIVVAKNAFLVDHSQRIPHNGDFCNVFDDPGNGFFSGK